MTPLTSHHLRGAAASVLISAGFALAWGLSGSFALPGIWRTIILALVVLLTLIFVTIAVTFSRNAGRVPSSTGEAPPNPFRTASYRIAVIAMLVAFPIAGRLLTLSGHSEAIMPVIAIIVGLHFIGLVPAFRSGIFGWVAGAFCLIGAIALFLPVHAGGVAFRQAFVGLGCAIALWLSVVPLTLTTLRQLAQTRNEAVQ